MAQNTQPIFTLTPHTSWTPIITAANTAMDGTGSVNAAFTATTNGSYLKKIIARANGTNASASVARIFLNNGSTNATPGNNALIAEIGLPITTASNSSPQSDFQFPLDFAIPASYVINVALGTAAAGGWTFTVVGGDY